MKSVSPIIVAIICSLFYRESPGQLMQENEIQEQVISDILEQFANDNDIEEFDYEVFIEMLKTYSDTPLNLNEASIQELSEFQLLSDNQIVAIVNHIRRNGPFLSIYELQSIDAIDIITIRRMMPFITVLQQTPAIPKLKNMWQSATNTFYTRWERTLQKSQGYLERSDGNIPFRGDPNKLYLQFRRQYQNKLSIGMTVEKDAGESITRQTPLDFSTFHLYYFNPDESLVKQIALGDFGINFGQGLLIQNGFATGKTSLTTSIKNGGRKVFPFSSVNENNGLRGFATTLSHRNLQATIFYSNIWRDANIVENDSINIFTSLQTSGLHQTSSEFEDRDAIRHLTTGASIGYQQRRTSINFNTIYHRFNIPFQKSDQLYNLFGIEGRQLWNASVDYNTIYNSILFFGENAISQNGGFALLNGLSSSLARNMDISILYRYYSKDYQSLFSNAFGESSNVNNENGIYFGTSLKLGNRWLLNTYADYWKHPWLRFRISAPSSGREYLCRLQYEIRKKMQLYLQWKNEEKQIDQQTDNPSKFLSSQMRNSLRLNLIQRLSPMITLRNRLEWSHYQLGVKGENGFLIYQDILYRRSGSPLSWNIRLAYHHTESYNSRIYAFENHLLRRFSIPAYFGKGIRGYFNLRWSINNTFTIECRFATIYNLDRENHGSGLNEIDNNWRSDVGVQLRSRF